MKPAVEALQETHGETRGRDAALPLRAVRRGWWLVPALALVCLGVAAGMTARQTPIYRASATLAVTPSYRVEGTSDILRALETLERRTVVATLAEIAAARRTLDSAAVFLGPPGEALCGGRGSSCYRGRGSVVPQTNVVRVELLGPDPRGAAELANAVAAVTAERAHQMYPIFTLRPLAEARPPRHPIRPDLRRNLVVAGILGLFLGGVATLGLEALASRTR